MCPKGKVTRDRSTGGGFSRLPSAFSEIFVSLMFVKEPKRTKGRCAVTPAPPRPDRTPTPPLPSRGAPTPQHTLSAPIGRVRDWVHSVMNPRTKEDPRDSGRIDPDPPPSVDTFGSRPRTLLRGTEVLRTTFTSVLSLKSVVTAGRWRTRTWGPQPGVETGWARRTTTTRVHRFGDGGCRHPRSQSTHLPPR